jgi:hypothetical protein
MAIQQVIDITTDLNNNDIANLDVGGFDNAEVQLVSPTGTFSFFTSNDAGAITGASDGSAASATNFTVLSGIDLATAAAATTLASSGIVKFSNIGQFLRITGAGAAQVTKAFVRLYKIN